jgi:hypothetical protein
MECWPLRTNRAEPKRPLCRCYLSQNLLWPNGGQVIGEGRAYLVATLTADGAWFDQRRLGCPVKGLVSCFSRERT